MKILKRASIAAVLSIQAFTMSAQQDAMYTHYMYNTLSVNPAYAGSRDALTATVLHRSQWVSFKGAPVTQTLTMHAPVQNRKIGLGLSAVNDVIGPVKATAVYGDFAYSMQLNESSKLNLGLKGGIDLMQIGLASLLLDQGSDPSFSTNISSKPLPNFGFGAYYHRSKFYAGVSVPRLLENNFKTDISTGTLKLATEKRHYYFISGAQFKLTEDLDIRPTILVKATKAAPLQADLTSTFVLHDKLLLGAMYRTGDAAGGLLGYNITDQLQAGYSFDFSFLNRTGKYNNGSHEIMLRYDFIFRDKERIRSPRIF